MSKCYGLIAAVVFAVAALWIPYTVDMWSHGHYQYFPLLLAAVAALLWSRRGEIADAATEPSPSLFVCGLIAVAVLTTLGHLLYSGLIGIVATVLGIVVLVYGLFGAGGLHSALAVLWLLIFAAPLPLDLDQSLILKMQFVASRLASQLLDGLGVMHVRQGVILITEKSQFLTEEACSGIRSLFSSLAVVSICSVSLRHRGGRIVFNLIQTTGWVLLGNAIRVAAVVILADNVDSWYATGTGHEMLGLVVFAFILAMVFSTDALMSLVIYAPEPDDFEANITPANHNEFIYDFPLGRWSLLPLLVTFCLVGILGLRVATVNRSAMENLQAVNMPQLPPPAENDLPQLLEGWERESFEHVERKASPILASDSYIWKYNNGRSAFLISVDCPWAQWHNLAMCYTALGWETKADYFIENSQAKTIGGPTKTQSELRMMKSDKSGFVIFAVVDPGGNELIPDWRHASRNWSNLPHAFLQQAMASLGFGVEAQFKAGGLKLPATTIQLLSERTEPFKPEELEEIRRLYDVVREKLLAGQRWAAN